MVLLVPPIHALQQMILCMQALLLALGHPETAGSQAASPFSAAMRNHGMNVTASVSSETSVSGDSIQDQIYSLTTTHKSSHKHLGAIVGSSVGSAAALIILLITTFVFGHGWLKKRRLQKQAAAWHKVFTQLCCTNLSTLCLDGLLACASLKL